MKKYILLLSAFVALMSCDRGSEIQPTVPTREVSIEAVATRTIYDGKNVVWESGDEVSVFFRHPESGFNVTPFSTNIEEGQTAAKARFSGSISAEVSSTSGYEDFGYAIYPTSVAVEGGSLVYDLPQTQTAEPNGSFQSGLNLASSVISLSDIEDDGSAAAYFRNALAYIRINLTEDVKSVTVTGTDPLTGKAPLFVLNDDGDENDNHGRLIIDSDREWSLSSTSVKLLPANGVNFAKGTYNLLIWPGVQKGLTVTLEFNNIGDYDKVSKISTTNPFTFVAGKYYNMNVNNTEELVIKEVNDALNGVENPEVDDKLTDDINALLAQVQSITLFSEYLDNAAYASYSALSKNDLVLDYIIRPESAAKALVEAFNSDKSVVSAVAAYSDASGTAPTFGDLSVNRLSWSDVEGVGTVVTAYINASNISDNFYNGSIGASVALQIHSKASDIVSDFANLVPKVGNGLSSNYKENIPIVPGARVVIPFKYSLSSTNASFKVTVDSENVHSAFVNNASDGNGNLSVVFNEEEQGKPIDNPSVTLVLTVTEGESKEEISLDFSFVDTGARISFDALDEVDYIGGDAVVNPTTTNVNKYMLSCSGSGVSGAGNIFSFSENTGGERKATIECQAEIEGGALMYYKSTSLTQKAVGSPLSRTYYTNGQKIVLNQANASGCPNYLNIVILGDGYKKKDLAEGGKFERNAISAMSTFFSIEPYATFMDRFNVYMVAYESKEEGTDIRSESVEKDTYFNTYFQGNTTECYVGSQEQVINVVKEVVGLSSDSKFYRTIVMMIVNTDQNAGSTGYGKRETTSDTVTYGEPYRSFAIAVVPSNSTGTNGLIKHEAGGHAFGRLGDEYYTGGAVTEAAKSELATWHSKGWYRNVCTSKSYWVDFTRNGYGSDEVDYHVGAWNYSSGEIYRSTDGGMMQNNVGVFNAPCRWYIYQRIRRQSEGYGDYWSDFLEYDREKNRNP